MDHHACNPQIAVPFSCHFLTIAIILPLPLSYHCLPVHWTWVKAIGHCMHLIMWFGSRANKSPGRKLDVRPNTPPAHAPNHPTQSTLNKRKTNTLTQTDIKRYNTCKEAKHLRDAVASKRITWANPYLQTITSRIWKKSRHLRHTKG